MENMDRPDPRVAYRLDCSWQLCPVPILLAEEKIADLAEGQVLEVVYTDPGAKADFRAWCGASGHTLVGFREGKPQSSVMLKKGPGIWKSK